ncbi:NADPH-dependent 7-cyano-7-deazaguanine reductase QueF [Dasania sp. GY-MA-18]|uniref:NADPH-dependent 7-cyano-7-deazaguanine reductase n=1 Tax=Dasania phycosphaerae TaxID=2950436 RepID=A0A9J6RS92_9GAMM|nr:MULTISPECIES: NADPH-dependent 7-cyano-7-deazaguanine reductase QueF [Dasania]MCR8924296.1 NADPH-dependent 7-cyano-7-deazaguanine reductase QueF [Dasania sp. GY-MA-18]MCZ0866949.1 NADPH-dependent 7-cyano-7-deazaguanine reductase QueF [Dasania phycosphaerae]MCZ0870453.1 NADPH-dependent 7-cyano-7-deazaguanine reductase QueF [Dasania phycosphaerae]
MKFEEGISLGAEVEYISEYSPDLLFPIARQQTRDNLGISNETLPFKGEDIWNAYELSWLNPKGLPQVAVAAFYFPCDSVAIIESKSFKLYLNSFNQTIFTSVLDVQQRLVADLSKACGGGVKVQLTTPDQWRFEQLAGEPEWLTIDQQDISTNIYNTDSSLLIVDSEQVVTEQLQSHLLRSLCPVTGQPDWGCLQISYSGQQINHQGLLRYIVSYREHQEFHEQCVERIFVDLMATYQLDELTVYARYVRRGGLDINPYRSTADKPLANTRFFRQ